LNFSAPTSLPSGYTYYALVSAVKTDASNNLLVFLQESEYVEYQVASGTNITAYPYLLNGAAGSITTPLLEPIALGPWVPSNTARVKVRGLQNSVNVVTMMAPSSVATSAWSAYNAFANPVPFIISSSGIASPVGGLYEFMLQSSFNLYIAASSPGSYVQLLGYYLNL
jgi:hypothetical protein